MLLLCSYGFAGLGSWLRVEIYVHKVYWEYLGSIPGRGGTEAGLGRGRNWLPCSCNKGLSQSKRVLEMGWPSCAARPLNLYTLPSAIGWELPWEDGVISGDTVLFSGGLSAGKAGRSWGVAASVLMGGPVWLMCTPFKAFFPFSERPPVTTCIFLYPLKITSPICYWGTCRLYKGYVYFRKTGTLVFLFIAVATRHRSMWHAYNPCEWVTSWGNKFRWAKLFIHHISFPMEVGTQNCACITLTGLVCWCAGVQRIQVLNCKREESRQAACCSANRPTWLQSHDHLGSTSGS